MPGPKKTRAQLKQAGIGGIFGTYRQPPEEPSATPTPTPPITGKSLRNQPLPGYAPPTTAVTPTPTPQNTFDQMRSFLDNWDKLIKGLGGK